MSYRPITDVWILARSKVPYYGAFPSGFLERARHLLGVGLADPVLHVCAGRVRDYPFEGFGPNDKTLDLDPATNPDFLQDARDPLPQHTPYPSNNFRVHWAAVLIDRPYTEADAAHYAPGADVLPSANGLLANALGVVATGGRVGILDYVWPHPPKDAKSVAAVAVLTGFNNRVRLYSVYKRTK